MTAINTEVTGIIKAFERPEKLLDLVASIRQYYPAMPLVIVDDSQSPLAHPWDEHTRYLHVEYDVGLSKGRNIAVNLVQTRYTLLLDDDFFFTQNTKIEVFLEILKNHSFDLVAGDVIDHGTKIRLFRGDMKIIDNKLHMIYRVGNTRHAQYPELDFVLNFFLAKTELLRQHPWDSDLKIREHEEFFWRLKGHGTRITYTQNVSVYHYPDIVNAEKQIQYNKMRQERLNYFHSLACQKIGVKDIISDGSSYQGPFRIFEYYSLLISWLHENKEHKVFAKIIWRTLKVFRPFLKSIYHFWHARAR